MRDQAGALVWRGRTAREGVAGTASTTSAAILHRLELPAQQHGLLAGLPGVRHLCRRGLVIAGQRIEPQVDARRQHEPVVGQATFRRRGRPCALADRPWWRPARSTVTPLGGDLVIAELLRLDLAQARDHLVAERAGGENPVRLDQRHLQPGIEPSQGARADWRRQSRRRSRRRARPIAHRTGRARTDEIAAVAMPANDISPRRHQRVAHPSAPSENEAAAVNGRRLGFSKRR